MSWPLEGARLELGGNGWSENKLRRWCGVERWGGFGGVCGRHTDLGLLNRPVPSA